MRPLFDSVRLPLLCALLLWCATAAASGSAAPTPPADGVLTGVVTALLDDTSFLLDDTVVRCSPLTVFDGISGVAELLPGDQLQVGGEFSGTTFEAAWVTLTDPGGGGGTGVSEWVFGTVAAVVDSTSFTLTDGTYVVTDASTVFLGFDGVRDLRFGDLVEAEGSRDPDGLQFTATWVQLVEPTLPQEVTGTVAVLLPPDSLILNDGTMATVHAGTVYVGLASYQEIAAGDTLRLSAVAEPWAPMLLVDRVELLARGGGSLVTFESYVEQVTPLSIVLGGGETVVVGPDTELVNFAALSEVVPGDRLRITAYARPGAYEAVSLLLLARPDSHVELDTVVEAVLPPDLVMTSDGYEIEIVAETLLVGLASIDELLPGIPIRVVGTRVDPVLPWRIRAQTLGLADDLSDLTRGNGAGLTSIVVGWVSELLPPNLLVLDGTFTVTVTADTEWRGDLTSFGDLQVGQLVAADLGFGQVTEAAWIMDLGMDGVVRDLSGAIREVTTRDDGTHLLLDSGEGVLLGELVLFDGDVSSVDAIVAGMFLSAWVVPLGGDEYLALEAFVAFDPLFPWLAPGAEYALFSEALVVLADGADPAVVASSYGATVAGDLPGMLVHLFRWAEPISDEILYDLLGNPAVVDAEPNYAIQDPESDPEAIRRRLVVADRHPSSGKFKNQRAAIDADITPAHERTVGAGTVVAVIDTGVDLLHPLLRHRIAPGGWDFVDGDAEPAETRDGIDQDGDLEVDESAGHGTFVAGLVLLAAPGASILPYRALDDDGHGTSFNVCLAVLAAINQGADVINLSIAYGARGRVLDQILNEASQRGIVLVAGAGNAGRDELPFPASDSRVIAVAAADRTGALADFSNHGPDLTIVAPGVDLYSAGIGTGDEAEEIFGTWSGTSMAAPLVSGAAALLRSVNPYLTPQQIADALVQSAAPLADGSNPTRRTSGRATAKTASPVSSESLPSPQVGLLQVSAALDLVPTAP